MDEQNHTGIVLLAAGASSRMGFPKQMISFRGESLLSHMSKMALASQAEEVLVVLGAGGDALTDLFVDIPVDMTFNPDWQKGIGTSIRHGVEQMQLLYPHLDSIIIMLCDQPFVDVQLLNTLIQTYRQGDKSIVACKYGGIIGVPVLYHRSRFDQLLQLEDKQGASAFVRYLEESEITTVQFEKGEIDLDTELDVLKFLKNKI